MLKVPIEKRQWNQVLSNQPNSRQTGAFIFIKPLTRMSLKRHKADNYLSRINGRTWPRVARHTTSKSTSAIGKHIRQLPTHSGHSDVDFSFPIPVIGEVVLSTQICHGLQLTDRLVPFGKQTPVLAKQLALPAMSR